jgi:acetolactate synthase-1/2/3 large subunit
LAKTISDLLEPGDIVVSETGCALAWMMQGFEFKPDQRFFHAFNFTPMGWGLPAAIGAALAKPGKRIVLVAGDGSLQMNLQELVTVTKHNLPIKVLLFNNHGHGMVQQTQEMWLGSKYYATSLEGGLAFPDFEKVAQAYGYPVFSVCRNEELKATLSRAIAEPAYSFTNIEIAADARVVPQVQFGRPNEDSSPLLDRKEFLENMVVEPLPVSRLS